MAMLFLFFIVRSLQQLPEFKSLDGCFSPKPGRKAGNLEFRNIVDVFRIAKNSFFKEIFADAEIFSIYGVLGRWEWVKDGTVGKGSC